MAIYNGNLGYVSGPSEVLDLTAVKVQGWTANFDTPLFETTGFGEAAITNASGAPGGTFSITALYPSTPETGLTASVVHGASSAGTDIDCYEWSYTLTQALEQVTGFADTAQAWYPVGPLSWTGSWATRLSDGASDALELTETDNQTSGTSLTLAATDTANDNIGASVMIATTGPVVNYNGVPTQTYNFGSTGAITPGSANTLFASGVRGSALGLQSTADSFELFTKHASQDGTFASGDISITGSAWLESVAVSASATDLVRVTANYRCTGAITVNHLSNS